MIRSFFTHEFKLTITSKKNLIFILFLFLLVLLYCFFMLPKQETVETFQEEKVQVELDEIYDSQERRREQGHTGFGVMTGPYYAQQEQYYQYQSKMLEAYENNNFDRYLHLRLHYLLNGGFSDYTNSNIARKSPIPGKDNEHAFTKTVERFQSYIDQNYSITYPIIVEKTALQQLKKLLTSPWIYLIIFVSIYVSFDMLTRDKNHPSLLKGFPISWYKTINIKSLVAFLYSLMIIIALAFIGLLTIGIMYGWGYLDMQIPIKTEYAIFGAEAYTSMPMHEFLIKSLSVLPILLLIFIRFNMWFSLLIKNSWTVLFISSVLLFAEKFYYSRTKRELFDWDISHLPQTYFDFGNVILFEKNFLINMPSITYSNGLEVLLFTLIVVEILLFITSKLVTRKRFFQT